MHNSVKKTLNITLDFLYRIYMFQTYMKKEKHIFSAEQKMGICLNYIAVFSL